MLKKILVITDNTVDAINGVATTYRSIEPHALADGYQIVYLTPSSFPHCSAPGYPEVKLCLPWNVGQKIAALEPDYIQIATEGPLGFAARCYLDRHRMKYNTAYHTRWDLFLQQIYGVPSWITGRYTRWFHKHSGNVLTTTDTMLKELQSAGYSGKIVVWTRGVDRDHLCATQEWRHDYYHGLRPQLLYVGRVSREKNIDELCKLAYRYDITVVGNGPDRERLERLYPRVAFPGYKNGAELADYYAAADVFVFPSKTDTFGIVIIEAMSVGTPVAAYPVAGPVDIITQGVDGYMSDELYEAIERCLALDREEVQRSSEQWTWSNCWQIFKDNLVEII
jgi:glycosyltransferase involved in cell wall biosynthesis